MSWTKKIKSPNDVVKPGDVIEVVVLEINASQEKLALGLKQLSPDPISRLKVGDVVSGKVASLTEFGAFIDLDSGLEALVRKSEMAEIPEGHAQKPLAVGEAVAATVIKLQKKERKIEASIRRHDRDEQRTLMKKYARPSAGPTLGDAIDWNPKPDE
jgi:ribosomal protein S1